MYRESQTVDLCCSLYCYQNLFSIANTAIKDRERYLNAALNLATVSQFIPCACELDRTDIARIK